MHESKVRDPLDPRPVSAVEGLIDYFNDTVLSAGHWTEDNVFSARSAQLRLAGNHVEAIVGPLQLHSQMRHLIDPSNRDVGNGWLASLRVITRTGRTVSADTPLRLQASIEALRTMDRLCRLLHMLNHLALGRERERLWLHVSLGHILSVPSDHGLYFEELLKRCGLGASQIGLVIPALPDTHPDFRALTDSISNYRARGYSVAIDLPRDWPFSAWRSLPGLDADLLRLRGAQIPEALAVDHPRAWILREVTDVTLRCLGSTRVQVILENLSGEATVPSP